MNRGTALLLAMAALLAHALAIHHDQLQRFAAPYDFAHVAYRLGRNLVHHGQLVWNLGGEGSLASYPSPMLVGLAALAERLYLPVTTFCQFAGIFATVLMVALSASFSTNRFAGIIPPLLFVVSGGTAAAAGSGTEYPLLAMFVTLTYVAFEHRWRVRFSLGMALCAATRPESLVLVAGFLVLGILERFIPRKDGRRAMPLWTYVPAAIVFGAFFSWEVPGGSVYGTLLAPLLSSDSERWTQGALYLWDFVVSAAIPLLLVYPLLFLLLGRLPGAGARALGLSLLWCGVVLAQGGGPIPYSLEMTPALPLIFIAIQQGVVAAIDTHRRFLELATWTVLTSAVVLSALASKFPGHLGPIPAYEWHRTWMTASTRPDYARRPEMGRLALDEEIRQTATARSFGAFLRRHLDSETSLLTPWPGALGYISRLRILDVFRRPTPELDPDRASAWIPRQTTDILAVLDEAPDYILPGLLARSALTQGDAFTQVARELQHLDATPSPERRSAIDEALAGYELIAVPVDPRVRPGQRWGTTYLLRKRSLDLAPRLAVEVEGSWVRVSVEPRAVDEIDRSLPQLAWLQVSVRDSAGEEWFLSPTAAPRNSETYARCGIVLTPSERRIELFRFELADDGGDYDEVSAVLLNPSSPAADAFVRVSEERRLELR